MNLNDEHCSAVARAQEIEYGEEHDYAITPIFGTLPSANIWRTRLMMRSTRC